MVLYTQCIHMESDDHFFRLSTHFIISVHTVYTVCCHSAARTGSVRRSESPAAAHVTCPPESRGPLHRQPSRQPCQINKQRTSRTPL
jgi:hypothetical protein